MNKYLLMSAAAVLASVTGASAAVDKKGNSGVQSVYLTGSGQSFCDAVTFAWNGANDQILDQESGCGSGYTGVFGAGNAINGKSTGIGQNSDASNSIENSNLVQLNYDFGTTGTGAPMNGGAFSAYVTQVTSGGATETKQYIAGHYYFGKPHKTAHRPATPAKPVQSASRE